VKKALATADIVALISLDVKGAFNVAWWPSILNGLKVSNCPQNLYNLSKTYFSDRSDIISSNNVVIQKNGNKGGRSSFLFWSWLLEYPLELTT
jgi:hypothetical protein